MSTADFSVPITDRYFEDYVEGSVYEYGPIPVNESEVVDFAQRFGRYAMGADRQRTAANQPEEITASEWHVVGLMMRLFVENFLSKVASIASPGVDEIIWPAPVMPGDSLRIRITIFEARRSRSKPDRGLVRTLVETFNQNGVLVLSLKSMNILLCRDGKTTL
jgi:acyl dehydratase